MKYIASTLLVCASYFVSAQSYQPVITPGKQFSYFHYTLAPTCLDIFYTQYFFNGDSVINGKLYTKMWSKNDHNPGCNPAPIPTTLAALLREDTVQEKVYAYFGFVDSSFAHNNSEIVISDFAKEPGDSILLASRFGDQFVTISAIDTIELNGILHNGRKIRVWKGAKDVRIKPAPNATNDSVLYAEYLPWYMAMPNNYFSGLYDSYFRCAWDVDSAGIPSPTFWYPNQQCGIGYIDVREETLTHLSRLEIYPNPANRHITVYNPVSGDFALYDVLGKEVLRSAIAAQNQTIISVGNLPAGIYVWIFETDRGVEKGKLMIRD